ncbi:MAG TPA: hypothetical protein PKV17_11885 [Aquabacterium sp.]|nr:hypothetical protein [Aquabacterium sp.]HRH29470.1 hypothetical protein [Aquabacterium sp.]
MTSLVSRRPWAARALIWATSALVVLAVGACSSMTSLLAPRTVEITKGELLDKLSQQFPMRNTVLDLFDVTCTTPRLTLQPEANRVLADVDLAAKDKLFARQYEGSLWMSFGLRYEPRDQTIRLQNVKIDKITFKGLPETYERHLTRFGSWLTEDRLQNYVVHRFTPDDLVKADKHGLTVTDIKITQKGLAIALAPKS